MDMSFENPATLAPADAAFGLRPLSWHGLCAQIAAMQDLRRSLSHLPERGEDGMTGSFDATTARHIATGFSGIPAQTGNRERLVNPTSSANGKALLAKTGDALIGVWTDHAEARD